MILFKNIQIFDGSGAASFPGEVLIERNRILSVARSAGASVAGSDVEVVDGHGATLMPGMTEAHAHLSWPSSVERFVPGMSLPPEELVLNTARNARILLDHGFTSAYSGGALAKTVEITLKAQIDAGDLPGPRLVPASIEREPPNETGYLAGQPAAEHGTGPEAVRAFVRECAAIGA
jgi:imidazolonepropionase-like amidohydrolase